MPRSLTPSSLQGFAAQRWLLGLLVFAIMVAIGFPLRARSQRQNDREEVSDALMVLVKARERYALDHSLARGQTIRLDQLLTDTKYLDGLPPALLEREVRLGPVGGRVAAKLEGEWFDPLPAAIETTTGSRGVSPPSQQ